MAVIPPTLIGAVSNGLSAFAVAPTLSMAHMVPAGTEALVVTCMVPTVFFTHPSVTWNGVPMERWQHRASGLREALFILIKPAPGSGMIFVDSHTVDLTNIAAMAVNVANFGGTRVFESEVGVSTQGIDTQIYNSITDLVLDSLWYDQLGITMTPTGGQTPLFNQGPLGTSGVKMAANLAIPTNPLSTTSMAWSASPATNFCQYGLAINGIDPDTPAGLPSVIGCVTSFNSLDAQPAAGIAPADSPQRSRHYIDANHPRLVVLVGVFDAVVDAVFFTPDSTSVELPLDKIEIGGGPFGAGTVWMRAGLPVGYGYIRIVLDRIRWWGGVAYSISADGLLATAANTGTSLTIPSSDGAIVVDYCCDLADALRTWAPDSGQVEVVEQLLVGTANQPDPSSSRSMMGASGVRIASGPSTDMAWTPSSVSGFALAHVGFSFIGIPPPPPGGEGCPTSLALTPADGVGCAGQITPQAV